MPSFKHALPFCTKQNFHFSFTKTVFPNTYLYRTCNSLAEQSNTDQEEFRVLDLKGRKANRTQRRTKQLYNVLPPRSERMPTDQDWANVWPGFKTFHPATVPLPLRQGINKLGVAPGKVANVELMKIPNFLHLTPPAIKKHCQALKQFCTSWPQSLNTNEQCRKHFSMEVIQTDYCHSSPSIRDPLSRIITINFPLSCLELDEHARDKFLRLVGERYNEETGLVTIVTDKCPLKQQNYDYAIYLLTAIFYESWTYEPWEKTKSEADMEYYDWDKSQSKENLKYLFERASENFDGNSPDVQEFKKAVITLIDDGENDYNLKKYKEASMNMLFPYKLQNDEV